MTPVPVVAPLLSDGVVSLRPHRDSDEAAIVEQCQDPQSVRWTSAPRPYGAEQARAFVSAASRGWARGGNRVWAIEVVDPMSGQPRFAGTIDYRPDGHGAADLGFGLHPAARGRGVAASAARLAVSWAFASDGIEVAHWSAYVGNWASRRTAWRCGFRVEGTVRRLLSANGRRYDAWVGSLTKGEPMEPAHRWLDVPVLEGERVRLRPWREQDAPAAVPGPLGPRYLSGLAPTPDTFEKWLTWQRSRMAEGEAVVWCIADPESDRPLGHLHLARLAERMTAGSGTAGCWLVPEGRGRGAATEALQLVVAHAFADPATGGLGLHRLEAGTDVDDVASTRVLRRAGFTLVGTEHAMAAQENGAPTDALLYELVAPTACPEPALSAVTLEGAGVRLRPWRQADDDRVVEASTDPVTRRWGGRLPSPYTEHDARTFRHGQDADLRDGSALSWCVADPVTDVCLGAVWVCDLLGEDDTSGEVGYWAHPQARGRGVMSEAVRLAVRHAFVPVADGGLGRRRLRLNVADGNLPSQRVALRAGFVEVGRDRLAERLGDGSYVDLVRYDLLESEYTAC